MTYKGDEELKDWLYVGEIEPNLVKGGVYGMLMEIVTFYRDQYFLHGVFDKGVMKGQYFHKKYGVKAI